MSKKSVPIIEEKLDTVSADQRTDPSDAYKAEAIGVIGAPGRT